ncbi:cuticle protein CP1499-like [Macrobrachium rosenbergii]|uniref:cuticle protein CP1499-like n=1 Tax=Macrobrachium rosenbergii TaxID=79674 RepID=UPI0034D49736
MRALVILAVLGTCTASLHQAYHSPYRSTFFGSPAGGPQPKWTGPLASSVPAGVDGAITQVSETSEVSAARSAFFNAYQQQLAAVAGGSGRYGVVSDVTVPIFRQEVGSRPLWHPTTITTSLGSSPTSSSFSKPVVPSRIVVSGGHVQDTPEVADAKSHFFRLFGEQAAAAAAAPDDEYFPRYPSVPQRRYY